MMQETTRIEGVEGTSLHGLRRRIPVPVIVLLSVAGAWISGDLVKRHADLWRTPQASTGLLAGLCAGSTNRGCGDLGKNSWSVITVPLVVPTRGFGLAKHAVQVPVAFLGLAYFASMAIWFACIGGPRRFGRPWHRLPLLVAALAAAASLFYLGVMALGRSLWCPRCMAVHGINLVMAIAVWCLCGRRRKAATALERLPATPVELAAQTLTDRQAITAVACSLALIAGLWAYRREHLIFKNLADTLTPYKTMVKALRADDEFLIREYLAQPVQEIPPRAGGASADGRPRLVLFTDLDCGSCRCAWGAIRRDITAAFHGEVQVEVRHYPLSVSCNPEVGSALHAGACSAAYAAEAARCQGGEEAFRQMHDLLLADRSARGTEAYHQSAQRIGLNPDRLARDMQSDTVRGIVAADVALARRLGVTGVPAMFYNGRRVPELLHTPAFWNLMAQSSLSSPDQRQIVNAVSLSPMRE